jgi:acyl-lipid omega-6 desaturase (Delta-12 desaturase)
LENTQSEANAKSARDWLQILAQYREPNHARSIFELFITALPLAALWALAWAALSVSYLLTLLIAIPAAGFLVRLFMIQHDCGHGAFFNRRAANDWVGRVLGVLTLTPYDVWRKSHATHHATSGNLDKRGIGDIATLTVREYRALPMWRRMLYRLYRHPMVMFGLGPSYLFFWRNRFPSGMMKADRWDWLSAMGTNAAMAAGSAGVIFLIGFGPFLMVHVPIVIFASSIGVWLFYVQHQFEDTFWAAEPTWQFHDAALMGSSHYDLPLILRWFTANIGIHHVHHLYSRIPYYRLGRVLRDHPELADVHRMTLLESLSYVNLTLWDEKAKRLVSFREARAR